MDLSCDWVCVSERRRLIAQNIRFLILPSTSKWPNLASRILKLTCDRLSQDWKDHFGHPVLNLRPRSWLPICETDTRRHLNHSLR